MIISCSTDNSENNESEQSLIIGTWNVEKVIEDGNQENLSDCEKTDTREFKSSNRFNFEYYGSSGENCINEGNEQGEWSIENNVLVLKWDVYDEDDPQFSRWPIIELSENKLVLKIEYTDEEEFPDGWYQEATFIR